MKVQTVTETDLEPKPSDDLETVVPRMLERRYHLTLVKGGPEYPHLPEHYHVAHM
mgnify:CR=1 FL=1